MDKRILIGMTLVVMLCAGVWWFISPQKPLPTAADIGQTSAPSQEIVHAPQTQSTSTELTPASSTSDTQRAAATEQAPIATHAPTGDTALVKVLALDKSTRAKMPGLKVTSRDTHSGANTWGEDHGLSRGKPWDTLRTDAEGRVEIEVPAHTELVVTASADRADVGYAMMTVDALEPGATKELVLEIPTGLDLPYWMKLVDETTRVPLTSATVSAKDGKEADQNFTCDAQGCVLVPTRSWSHALLHVQAPEHAELYLMAERGHERIENALVVALASSATLRAHVVDADGASVVAARVVLTTPGYNLSAHDDTSMSIHRLPDPRWEKQTDASGIATFTGLPPHVPIKASIEGPTPWTSAQDLAFEPGETRDVEWKLTGGCQVHGVLLDQTNAPVVAREMWLRKAERKMPAYLNMYSSGDISKTMSDQLGRFQFGTVSPGAWWVGPAPVERGKQAAPDDVAALAQVLEVVEGQREIDLTLRVDRGLRITGKVLDPKGAPANFASLSAYDEKSRLYTYAESRDAGGEYVIGPLMAGRYLLKARAFGADAESLAIEVEAGAHDIVLQLRPGATIAGTVVDESGQPIPAVVCVSQRDVKLGMKSMSPRPNGVFELKGLEPGMYQVSAHTGDGRIGIVENVEASTTDTGEHVVVKLRPGGHVRVRHHGPEKYCNVSLFQNGIELSGDGVAMGAVKDMIAPVGTVVVKASFYEADRTFERTVDVKAGETVDVVFEKDAH